MFSKGSKLYSIFNMKCPRCQEGDLFISKNPFVKTTEMHKTCSHCELRYEKEVGFFYGAMYVSYMLNIALFVTTIVSYFLWFEAFVDWKVIMGIYLLLTVLLLPIYLRFSRSIWINFWQSFDPQKRGAR